MQSSDILELARECLTQDDLVELIDKLTALLEPGTVQELDAYRAGLDEAWDPLIPPGQRWPFESPDEGLIGPICDRGGRLQSAEDWLEGPDGGPVSGP